MEVLLEYVGSAMSINMKSGMGKQSSNSRLVSLIPFCTNAFGKGINPC